MIKRNSAKDFAIFNTVTEYEAEYNKRSEDTPIVDDETICFISSEGTIYTHGIKFGGSSSSSEGTIYTAGTGIDISNNLISVNTTWLDDRIQSRINNITPGQGSTTIGLATDTTIGGFKTGYINNGKNYKVQLDSDGRAFVNVPWSSTVINPDDPNSQYYDDLEDRLNTLQGLIDGLRSDLNGIHQTSEQDIEQMIKNILILINWLKQNFPIGELFHFDDWSDELNAYLKGVGILNEDGTAAWSLLIQELDRISGQVTAIQHSIGENGNIDLATLQSELEAYINDQIAGLDLTTRYAVQNENQEVIRWMTSGFRSQAGKQEGEEGYYVDFAQMYADAFDGVNNATAAVTTKVNFVKDKIESAEALMGTSLNNWLAGVVTQSNKDSAVAALFAEDSESDSKAAIMATVKNDQSFLDLVADRVTIDADITAIRGYLEAGDATFKGTVKADNLYRNIQFCYQSMDNAQRAAVSYAKPLYQYTEDLNDPDPIPEFVNGGLYTEEYINAVVNSGGLTPDGGTIARWYEVNGEKFHVCTGKSDIIILTANIYSDALGDDDECIILPDPEFNQGKLIEIYSGNHYSNEPDRPYFFKVSSVSGGNILAGYYNWDENLQNYSQSDVVDWSACCLGEPYRFIATTAKINGVEKAVWVKLQVSNQLLTDVRDGVLCIHFTRETYLYFDGQKLRLHTPSLDKEVMLVD